MLFYERVEGPEERSAVVDTEEGEGGAEKGKERGKEEGEGEKEEEETEKIPPLEEDEKKMHVPQDPPPLLPPSYVVARVVRNVTAGLDALTVSDGSSRASRSTSVSVSVECEKPTIEEQGDESVTDVRDTEEAEDVAEETNKLTSSPSEALEDPIRSSSGVIDDDG